MYVRVRVCEYRKRVFDHRLMQEMRRGHETARVVTHRIWLGCCPDRYWEIHPQSGPPATIHTAYVELEHFLVRKITAARSQSSLNNLFSRRRDIPRLATRKINRERRSLAEGGIFWDADPEDMFSGNRTGRYTFLRAGRVLYVTFAPRGAGHHLPGKIEMCLLLSDFSVVYCYGFLSWVRDVRLGWICFVLVAENTNVLAEIMHVIF